MSKKTLTIALMDPPYESENITTAFRILDAAARRGHTINVFAYEGASALAFTKQVPHPNPVHDKGSGGGFVGSCREERRQGRLGELRHVRGRTRRG